MSHNNNYGYTTLTKEVSYIIRCKWTLWCIDSLFMCISCLVGICAMCGKKIANTKAYKQSSTWRYVRSIKHSMYIILIYFMTWILLCCFLWDLSLTYVTVQTWLIWQVCYLVSFCWKWKCGLKLFLRKLFLFFSEACVTPYISL